MDNELLRKIERARQQGYDEDTIVELAYRDVAKKQAQQRAQPSTQPEKKGFQASDLIPLAGGVLGATVGSTLGPVGTALGGGAGAAGGEFVRQKITGEKTNVGRIALEGALSAIPVEKVFSPVLRGAGKLLGKTAGKEVATKAGKSILSKTGAVVEGAGKKLGLRAIKAAPTTDIADFKELTGVALEEFQAKNKLYGSTEQILKKTGQLIQSGQNKYNNLVRTGEKVEAKDFVSLLKAKAKEMAGSGTEKTLSPEIKATANALRAKAKFIKKAAGKSGKVTIDKIVEAKGATFKNVSASTMKDAAALNADKIAGGIGIEYLESFAPGSANIGKNLQALREFLDIVKKRAGKGKGSELFNIHKAGYAGAAMGSLFGGGIPGAIVGAAAGEALNSPKTISIGSQLLQKTGKAISGATLPSVPPLLGTAVNQTIRQAGRRAIVSPAISATQDSGVLPENLGDIEFPPDVSAAGPAVSQEAGGYTKEQLIKAADWDIANNGGKGLNEIKQLYDLHFGANKPKAATTKNMENLATAGLRGLADAQALFESDPHVVTKGTVTRGLSGRKFEAALGRAIEGILRARSGAAVPESEVKKYRQIYGPRLFDSKDVALYKLEALRQDLEGILTGNENIVPDNQLPSSPAMVSFPQ